MFTLGLLLTIALSGVFACSIEEEKPFLTPSASEGATPAASPPPVATPTPEASPEWKTYEDAAGAFRVSYPPDLVFRDMSPGPDLRAFDFRSERDGSRAFVISIEDSLGQAIDQWAVAYAACPAETIRESVLGGMPAIACVREVVEDVREPAVLTEVEGRIYLISHIGLTDAEFSAVVGSFRFLSSDVTGRGDMVSQGFERQD